MSNDTLEFRHELTNGKPTKPKRRWLNYSLRTALLALTVLCIWLGLIVNRVNKQKQAIAWVREHGGTALYDFQWNERGFITNGEPPGPDWLRERVGIDYFADVAYVSLDKPEISDVDALAPLTEVRALYLRGTTVSDLSPLAKMTKMQQMDLSHTQVSDLSPLAGMQRLQVFYVHDTRVSDLSPLAKITGLKWLDIHDTQVSDLSPLAKMKEMQSLFLKNTPVTDLSPLAGMNGMCTLDLLNTHVSDLTPLLEMQWATIVLDSRQEVAIPPELELQIQTRSSVNRKP